MAWVNNHCGWAGGVNTNATEDGAYKFIGLLQVPLPSPENVQATPYNHNVNITWTVPTYNPSEMTLLRYNITRNGTQINATLITTLSYTDMSVESGSYTYCVMAQYNIGESQGSCKTVDVAVGITHTGEQPTLLIYPNPAHGRVMVKTSGQDPQVIIYDQMGNVIPVALKNLSTDLSTIDISALPAGMYMVSLKSSLGTARTKLVVY